MGVEYNLIKVETGAAYDLGKPAIRPPVDDWEDKMESFKDLSGSLPWLAIMQPSDHAIWQIGSHTLDCEITVLSKRWDCESLAAQINIALFNDDNMPKALRIADDILKWAGSDPVVLIPDTLYVDTIADRFGVNIPPVKVIRTVQDVNFTDDTDAV